MKKAFLVLWNDFFPYLIITGLFFAIPIGIVLLRSPDYVNTTFYQEAVKEFGNEYRLSEMDPVERDLALILQIKEGWFFDEKFEGAEEVDFSETKNLDFRYVVNQRVILKNKDPVNGYLLKENLYIYNGFSWMEISERIDRYDGKDTKRLNSRSVFDEEDVDEGDIDDLIDSLPL